MTIYLTIWPFTDDLKTTAIIFDYLFRELINIVCTTEASITFIDDFRFSRLLFYASPGYSHFEEATQVKFCKGQHLTENYSLESGTIICKINYNL